MKSMRGMGRSSPFPKRYGHWTRLASLLTLCALVAACARVPAQKVLEGPTMGTTYHVTILRPEEDRREAQAKHCVNDVLAAVDAQLSTYNAASEISALNRNDTVIWTNMSEPLYSVIAAAARVSAESNGA